MLTFDRIFEKSVRCIETLNGASVDADISRFQWHIGGHAAFVCQPQSLPLFTLTFV